MANQNTYKARDVVAKYSIQNHLYKHEKRILDLFRNKLRHMKMLDVGVGGGRTTYHFAPAVKEYVGIDYSDEMITACKRRFSKYKESYKGNISFRLCDVRSMSIFNSNYFDFILVSANGLDYIPHDDRLKA